MFYDFILKDIHPASASVSRGPVHGFDQRELFQRYGQGSNGTYWTDGKRQVSEVSIYHLYEYC